MPSRMELTWDEKTGNDKGALQAAQIYHRAADVYDEMLSELIIIKNQSKLYGMHRKWK